MASVSDLEATVRALEEKIKKLEKLIEELADVQDRLKRDLVPNRLALIIVYQTYLKSDSDMSEGTMITYFEDTTSENFAEYKSITRRMHKANQKINIEKTRAEKLLDATKERLESVKAALETARNAEKEGRRTLWSFR